MKPIRTIVMASCALAAACGTGKKEEGAEAKVTPAVGATVATVATQKFVETLDAVGMVSPRAGHVAEMAAPAATRVSRVFVAVGSPVKAGDPLIEFEQAAFDAAAKGAEATLAAAEKAAARAQRLADAGVLPRKDAEMAAADLGQARLNAVTAQRSRELSTLRSPIGGVITRMSAMLGASVDPTQSLVEVVDPDALDVMLSLPPAEALRAKPGMTVALFASADAAGEPVASGRVSEVSAAVDTSSRGVIVRVAVTSGARGLRVGGSSFGRITVAEHGAAVVVPLESLVPDGEGFRVFTVDDKGIAHAQKVTIGARSDKVAWVTDGVRAGQRVVTGGAYGMDDSARVVTGKP
jgi:RND family efflux transporter MFP subunit